MDMFAGAYNALVIGGIAAGIYLVGDSMFQGFFRGLPVVGGYAPALSAGLSAGLGYEAYVMFGYGASSGKKGLVL